jgi:hypothetical protein
MRFWPFLRLSIARQLKPLLTSSYQYAEYGSYCTRYSQLSSAQRTFYRYEYTYWSEVYRSSSVFLVKVRVCVTTTVCMDVTLFAISFVLVCVDCTKRELYFISNSVYHIIYRLVKLVWYPHKDQYYCSLLGSKWHVCLLTTSSNN